jgi:hypothetical protein
MIYLILIFNFAVSWFNAWACGRTWNESKRTGGWPHFVTWCAAVMSACGFTWVYLFFLALVAGNIHHGNGVPLLSAHRIQQMVELGYVVIILPMLGSGLGITLSSWQTFNRNRSLMTGGVAAYNTFAEAYNTIQAIRVLPGIFGDLGDLFKRGKDEDDDTSARLVLLLVAFALLSGVLTTTAIIRRTARVHALEVSAKLFQLRT